MAAAAEAAAERVAAARAAAEKARVARAAMATPSAAPAPTPDDPATSKDSKVGLFDMISNRGSGGSAPKPKASTSNAAPKSASPPGRAGARPAASP